MRNLVGGFILLAIGTLLLLDNLGIADFGEMIGTFWPIILIVIGISILLRRRPSSMKIDGTTQPFSTTTEPSQQLQDDLIHESGVFGNIFFEATSKNFKGGSLSTVFGDSIVNLSNIQIAAGEHVLRVHGVFGNTTVRVPTNTAIAITASTVLGEMVILGQRKGGFSSDLRITPDTFASAPNRLVLQISRVFGNVRVS